MRVILHIEVGDTAFAGETDDRALLTYKRIAEKYRNALRELSRQ